MNDDNLEYDRLAAEEEQALEEDEEGEEHKYGLSGEFGAERSASQIDGDGSNMPELQDFAELNGTSNNGMLSSNGVDQ